MASEREEQIARAEATQEVLADLGRLSAEDWECLPREIQRDIAGLLVARVIVGPQGHVPRLRVEWHASAMSAILQGLRTHKGGGRSRKSDPHLPLSLA